MAVTAHSDPYGIFMRKIGYSVGLERTLERLSDLERLYVSSGDITLASWKELIHGESGWGLKTSNIADVFFSLRFIQQTASDVLALENLDSMAIVCELLKDEREKEKARAFLFLWALLVNDGEIFVNLLLSNFDDDQIRVKLAAMIEYKRSFLNEALPGKESLKKISRVVNIDRQKKNKGSAGAGQSIETLKRTEPIETLKRTGHLSGDRSFDDDGSAEASIVFSDDYFRKVPPRRKDWARSLGFWDDNIGLTSEGHKFKDALAQHGYICEDDIFVFWPMDFELVRAGFRPNLLPNTKSLWDAVVEIGAAFAGIGVRAHAESDADEMVELTQRMMKVYRSLHARKAMLRREMIIAVAYPATIALACARGDDVIDLPKALAAEQKGEKRRIAVRQSRNTGGALSLKR